MAKMKSQTGKPKVEKMVTRYTFGNIKEPITPETRHTPLLPAGEQIVSRPIHHGRSEAVAVVAEYVTTLQ